jgi:4-amino-4-deoxy-L-arabinose transferase-like glycosyltransferase
MLWAKIDEASRHENLCPRLLTPVMAFSTRTTITTALVALLLATYAWVAWSASLGKGPAFDESAHLTAGYSYWKFNDYRLQPENGNLPQRWAALPLLALGPRLDPADAADRWMAADVWKIGQRFLYESGNSPELMLSAGRAAMTLWGVACGLLVFFWSRRLWGDAGGVLSLALFAGSATLLAHGPMVTSDMTAAFCLLAATGAFWRQLEKPGRLHLATSLALTGLASIAKFSVLLLPFIYGLLLLWHFLWLPEAMGERPAWTVVAGRVAGLVAAHVATAALVVWAAFGFRYQAEAPGLPPLPDFYIPWDNLLPASGARRHLLLALKEYRLLPEAYTHGLAYVLRASEARGAFAAGHVSTTGWWWFFPYTFLLKSSLAELGAVILLAGAATHRWLRNTSANAARDLRRIAPLLVFVAIYGTASITSNLNIGHRHILPLYLPLFILTGVLLRHSRFGRLAAAILLLGQAIETSRAYPSYLAYFNPIGGAPDQRWRHLVDSSLDWGQELPALGDWLRQHRRDHEPVYLTYFGVGDPRHEGIEAVQFAPFSSVWREPTIHPLRAGLYCVSATILQDTYSPLNGPWTSWHERTFKDLSGYFLSHPEAWQGYAFRDGTDAERLRWNYERARFARIAQYLRMRRPEAVIGHSILVYRLDAREVSLAIDLPPAGLIELLESAIRTREDVKAAP